MEDAKSRDKKRPNSGYLPAMHGDGDGYDGVQVKRRASNKGCLGLSFTEYVELLEAIAQRERVERDGGDLREYPSVLQRLGIGRAAWEKALRLTSRRFEILSIDGESYRLQQSRRAASQ